MKTKYTLILLLAHFFLLFNTFNISKLLFLYSHLGPLVILLIWMFCSVLLIIFYIPFFPFKIEIFNIYIGLFSSIILTVLIILFASHYLSNIDLYSFEVGHFSVSEKILNFNLVLCIIICQLFKTKIYRYLNIK